MNCLFFLQISYSYVNLVNTFDNKNVTLVKDSFLLKDVLIEVEIWVKVKAKYALFI